MDQDKVTKASSSKFKLAEKYQGLDENIWQTLRDLNPNGDKVTLGSGYPDFPVSLQVIQKLEDISKEPLDNSLHQYTRSFGHPRLVKALANLYGTLLKREIDPLEEVLISVGAYGALFTALMANVGVGDECIIIEPYFDCYTGMIQIAGGTTISIPLRQTDTSSDSTQGWTLDFKELESKFNERTKVLILNTPNNPLGKVYSLKELTEIAKLCIKYNVICISDEVYEWIIYDDKEHVRIASLEGMWERTLCIGSAGKNFCLTGWRLGWIYGPKELMKNVQVAHVGILYNCSTPGQEALARAFEDEINLLGTPQSLFFQLRQDLTTRRNFMVKAVQEAGFKPIIPEGGYMLMVDWSPLEKYINLGQDSSSEDKDVRFVKWLANSKDLICVPPSAFYTKDNKHLAANMTRFCFFKTYETLEKAKAILNSIKNEGHH